MRLAASRCHAALLNDQEQREGNVAALTEAHLDELCFPFEDCCPSLGEGKSSLLT